jgi:hypothetical protein
MNPVAVTVGPINNHSVVLFGINSSGHLIEFFEPNSQRESSGTPSPFQYTDISSVVGLTCDSGVSPAAVVRNGGIVVFADCGGKIVDFYPNASGVWTANTGITGNSIPGISHAFPNHSLTAMVVSGSPSALEAYVALDYNGAEALGEYLYDGSGWHNYTVPLASGHYFPDQVYAQTVIESANTPTYASEVIAVDPASSCSSLPAGIQYLYQPNLPNPSWKAATLPKQAVTSMQAIVEQSGTVLTEAFTGAYIGPTITGGTGGSGCTGSNGGVVYENFSGMTTTSPQPWYANTVNSGHVDNEGIEPAGIEFPY